MKLIQFRNICIYLFIVSFFFSPRLQTLFISVAFFITFFTGEFSNFKSQVFKNKLGWALILFFTLYLISMLYSDNQASGWSSIESKFSLIAFPLFLPLIFNDGINKKSIIQFINYIALSYIVLSFGKYFYDYFILNDYYPFKGSNIGFKFYPEAKKMHPTYLSFYYLVIILFKGDELINDLKYKRKVIFSILNIGLFSFFVIFLSSKVAFIGLFVIIILLIGKYAKKNGKIKQSLLIFGGFIVILIFGIYNSSLYVKFEQTYLELTNTKRTNESYIQSTGARIWFWKTTAEIIQENPIIGVGAGDIRDELSRKYNEKEIKWIQDKGRDSHQQYLQTFATLGIFGFLSLLSIFILMFYYGIKNKNFILFGFTLIYFIFGFTESMFETQAGIIFFTFFALFLVSKTESKIEKEI